MRVYATALTCCLWFLSCFFVPAFAQPPATEAHLPHAEVESDPSSIVAGCVNVITGTYGDADIDIVMPGPEPLVFQRFYCSRDWNPQVLGDSWSCNHALKASISAKDNEYIFTTAEPTGGALKYYGGKYKSYRLPNNPLNVYQRKSDDKGLTNTASGEIGGRTNLKNHFVDYHNGNQHLRVHQGDGVERTFILVKSWKDGAPPLSADFVNRVETRRNGNRLFYDYEHIPDFGYRLSRIQTTDAAPREDLLHVFAHLDFDYADRDADRLIIRAKASDGRQLNYTLHKKFWGTVSVDQDGTYHPGGGVAKWYLTEAVRPNGPRVNYRYSYPQIGMGMVNQKVVADRIVQEIDYHPQAKQNKSAAYKVAMLKAPVGVDATPIPTYHFLYGQRTTEVRDAYGYTTCYDFNDDERLTMIRRYRGQSNLELYSLSRLFWGSSSKNQQANLICQTLQASDNRVHSCRLLEYDDKHNVTVETLVGNLTGGRTSRSCRKYALHTPLPRV